MCKRELKISLLIQILGVIFNLDTLAFERGAVAGARESALANAVVALPGSFTIFHNQAFLSECNNPAVGISYRQPYFIKGYSESAIALTYPISTAVFAVAVSQTSVASYKESNLGIALSKVLARNLSAGLLFNYFYFNLPESGQHKGSIQVDGGIRYVCSSRLKLGFHIRNMFSTQSETFQYQLTFPLFLRSGVSFGLTERLLLVGESYFEKDIGVGIRLGTEAALSGNFMIRVGLSTKPVQHSLGFGYKWKQYQLDFAMVHHEMLGYTPLLSLSFILNKS